RDQVNTLKETGIAPMRDGDLATSRAGSPPFTSCAPFAARFAFVAGSDSAEHRSSMPRPRRIGALSLQERARGASAFRNEMPREKLARPDSRRFSSITRRKLFEDHAREKFFQFRSRTRIAMVVHSADLSQQSHQVSAGQEFFSGMDSGGVVVSLKVAER